MRQEGIWRQPASALMRDPAVVRPDRISLTGIPAFGHHGVFAFEREQGQRFVVDLICELDLSAAAANDDLGQTIDYGALAQAVVADVERDPLNLIEALADRIAADVPAARGRPARRGDGAQAPGTHAGRGCRRRGHADKE